MLKRAKRFSCLTFLLVLPAALLATACMWGVVRNADTGLGVEGATVSYTDSFGHTGSTTTGAGGLYAFDSARGPIPAAGSVAIEVSAPGFASLATDVTVLYDDNPNATLANLSSFWEVRSFDLTPLSTEGTIDTLASSLHFPVGAVYDENGDLFFSERDTCRVRKLDVSAGTISNVAGNGTCGYSGDGGAATSAGLSAPSGLGLDDDDHLAIATNGDCRVRVVDLDTGDISTAAGNGTCGFAGDGGPATSAQLRLTAAGVELFAWSDVAFDASGNLYIADIFNCRIRKVSGGTISTIAGSGSTGFTCGAFSGDGGPATSARMNQPSGVAVDDHGNVFIGELGGCRVRKVTSGGTISTIAGTGVCTPSGNGGDAVDAGLAPVRGLALDDDGNVFISQFTFNMQVDPMEEIYCQVRRIDEGGTIDAVAGTGTCGFDGDGGLAVDAEIQTPGDIALACNGDLAFTSALDDRIRVVHGVNEGGPAPGNMCP